MLFTTTLAVGASLLSLTEAIQLQRRTDGPSRVIELSTSRKRSSLSPPVRDRLRKRQSKTLNVNLDNEHTLYFANVSIGTPAQSLRLDIDTGSSDLWTNSASSQLCQQNDGAFCATSGTYNANDSSTYEYVNSAFLIRYADGSQAQGDYAKDTVTLGNLAMQGVQFGIGYDSSSSQGILGVGYATNEASIGTLGKTYPNVPQQLVDDGVIAANAYSLYLNDLDASTGSILFGGVDTTKYTGSLQTVPVIKERGVYQEFLVALSGLGANGQTLLTADNSLAVLLDSGSSLSYLPDALANDLYNIFNAQYDSQAGAARVSCDLATSNPSVTVDFAFSGATISVPLDELVIIDGYRGNGRPVCILGISSTGSNTPVLGDTFLRSAYVVYDLDNNEISLAQTNFNQTGRSDVQEIAAGASGVPGATMVATPISTAAVSATGGARNGGNPTVNAALVGRTPAPVAVAGAWVAVAAAVGAMAV